MASPGEQGVSLDRFKMLVEHVGLNLSEEELADLKPLYDLYWQQLHMLHSIDFGPEEMAVAFNPNWPS